MANLLTNRLLFLSNAKYILELIRTKPPSGCAPPPISLNAIRPMPECLALPLTRTVRNLARMNMAPPEFSTPEVQAVALAKIFRNKPQKQTRSAIERAIDSIRTRAARAPRRPSGGSPVDLFERAVANYRQHGYFCHYDWRWKHWGTIAEVHSAVPSTFKLPTTAVEFKTQWTPPLQAMEALAQMFPSVRFELSFRYRRSEPWSNLEIFPTTPFGY